MDGRITVLYPVTDLARDGAQRQLFELVRGLDKNRFRPILLTLRRGGPMEEEFGALPGVQVLSLERKGKYDFLCLLKVSRILRSMKIDVVQPFLTPATFFGLLPALWCRVPVKIVTERASRGNKHTGPGYRFYLGAEDFLCRFCDWAVPNSQAGGDYLVQRGIEPSKVKVIYNGIDFSRLKPDREDVKKVRQRLGIPPGGKVVGMMARLFPVKNHIMFLQAAALVNKAMPETRFALVGDGPLRSRLEEYSNELGLNSKVVFFGEQRDAVNYLSAFDVATLTSDAEGCSNSLLEAMALGKPVVATDVGGNRELIRHGETGILVPPGNTQSFSEAVLELLRSSEAARVMGQNASETVRARFGLADMVREYESLYESGLRAKSGERESTPKRQ